MSASVPPLKDRLSETIGKLRRLCQLEVQFGWRYCDTDSAVPSVNICNWPVAKLNEKGHIAWPAGKQILLLGQQFVTPNNLYGYPVAGLRLLLGLTWWAEDAQIFVNGELVGRGDLFDCRDRVLLTSSATPGDEFLVVLRLVSPGHDAGALVRSICLYEASNPVCFDPGFVADELEIFQNLQIRNLRMLNSQYLPTKILAARSLAVKGEKLKSAIDLAVELIDWSALPDREKFDRSLSVLRRRLLKYLQEFCGDFNDEIALGAEGAGGERKKEVSGVGESGNATSIYIGEVGDRTSVDRDFDGGNAENAEVERKREVSDVGESGNPTSIYIGEIGDRTSVDRDFDGGTAEGEINKEIFAVGESGNPTSIYIEEVDDRTSAVGDLDGGTAEDAESTEGEINKEIFAVGDNGNPTSIYIGEVGDRTSIYMGKIYLLGHAHI